jgi:hypothetical protein
MLLAAARSQFAPKRDKSGQLETQKRDALEKVERLAKRSLALIQRRHDIMHDAWGVDPGESEPEVIRVATLHVRTKPALPVPIQALHDIIRDFRVIIDEVSALTISFRTHPPFMADLRSSLTKAGSSAIADKEGKP